MQEHILVCDDDPDIVRAIAIYLEAEGYRVSGAHSGEEALRILRCQSVHLILLDIMMPGMDGIATALQIRRLSSVPILILSAKSQASDKVLGLNVGADDYITKPFDPLELVARVRSNLRRYLALGSAAPAPGTLTLGPLQIDDTRKTVRVDGEEIRLTPTEYRMLLFFCKNPGQVFSIAQIYENVWGEPFDGAEKKVVLHISHLREKIEIDPRDPQYLKTVWGLGYKIQDRED